MAVKKVQTFLAIGGPLHGHTVTEQYAGNDYTRFNSGSGEIRNYERIHISPRVVVPKYTTIQVPKCVLLYFPENTTPEQNYKPTPA